MKSSRRLWVILAVIILIISVQLACSLPGKAEEDAQMATYEAEETQTRAARRTETKAARQTEKAEEDIYEATQEAVEGVKTETVSVTQKSQITVEPVQVTKVSDFKEPIPGLAGKWQYYGIHSKTLSYEVTFEWDGSKYKATGCTGYNEIKCELKGSTWDGSNFNFTLYFPVSKYTTNHLITRESMAGDTLTAARSGTGGEGIIILVRAP